jgi:hypothetical protein
MPKLSRPPLFTTEPSEQGMADGDIFPREVRTPVLRMLWLGLLAMLVALVVIVMAWRTGAA